MRDRPGATIIFWFAALFSLCVMRPQWVGFYLVLTLTVAGILLFFAESRHASDK